MSSGDELGGFEPTTPGPAPARKGPAARPAPRAVAGPSSKLQKPLPAKKTARKDAEIVATERSPDITMISSDEDNSALRKTTANKGKRKASQAQAHTNGVSNAKQKVKAKTDLSAERSSDAVEVDNAQVIDLDVIPPVRLSKSRPNAKAAPSVENVLASKREKRELDSLKRENERLRKRLEDADTHNTKLSEQLEKLMKIRQTDAEKLMEERVEQYEATTRAQDLLIQEQSAQLATFKVLADSGRLDAVPFLSREQADAEMRSLENKVKVLSEAAKNKDARISELQQENKELQIQLEHEIKMAKSQKPSRQDAFSKNDTKADTVIKLYERLTNFLVLNVERSTFHLFGLPETKYRCLYTHIDDPSGEPSGSDPCLSFDLVDTWARRDGQTIVDIRSKDELEEKTMYIPRELDKLSNEFRVKLDFFNEEFLFTPTQMNVFLRTLGDSLSKTTIQDEGFQERRTDQLEDEYGNGQNDEQRDDEVMEVVVEKK